MDRRGFWRRLEENEEGFLSLWCDALHIPQALLFWNRRFADDPIFNHARRVATTPEEADALVERVVKEFRVRGIPPCCYVSPLTTPPALADRLRARGFRHLDRMLVMHHVGGEASTGMGIAVEEADEATSGLWAETYMRAFDISQSAGEEVKGRCARLAKREEANLYLAFAASKPAGTLALYSEKGVGGVYCVGTLPAYRGRGVATALLHRAVAESQRRNEALCLQTMGRDGLEGFYRRRGFAVAFIRSIYLMP